ncbi:MAG TPA: DUF58 domain-containing protein [Thermoanaerobaculia bacterium]|nr:DUF58 domain-containing protein [Thermoanaerobaculia bacterium]
MIPGARLFLLLGLAALLLAATPGEPRLLWPAAALDAIALVGFLVDARRARALNLSATRRLPPLLAQGSEAPIVIEIAHDSPRPLEIELREALHPALAAAPRRVRLRLGGASTRSGAQSVSAWNYTLVPRRRGSHDWGPLSARVLGPWGLAWHQRELLPAAPVRIYPQVRWGGKVGRLLALAHRRELGQSPTRLEGIGSEPYALRQYRSGDPLSRIHWRATARQGRLVAREDTWERGTHLLILLDCGRAMTSLDGTRSKLDHALAASLALLRLAIGRGDRVAVLAFADRVERRLRIHPGTGGARTAYAALYDLEARLAEPNFDLAGEQALQLEPRRGVAVLFTSVVDLAAAERLQHALRRLERRHRTLLVNLEDPQVGRLAWGSPTTPPEAFAKVAAMEILLANRRLARELSRAGVLTVSTAADRLALAALDAYLSLFQRPRAARSRRAG